jgi:hypothetical protein
MKNMNLLGRDNFIDWLSPVRVPYNHWRSKGSSSSPPHTPNQVISSVFYREVHVRDLQIRIVCQGVFVSIVYTLVVFWSFGSVFSCFIVDHLTCFCVYIIWLSVRDWSNLTRGEDVKRCHCGERQGAKTEGWWSYRWRLTHYKLFFSSSPPWWCVTMTHGRACA